MSISRRHFIRATSGLLLAPSWVQAASTQSFTLSGPSILTLTQGESVQAYYRAIAGSKPYRPVSFSVTSLPPGVTAVFFPVSCTPTCQVILTLTASLFSVPGDYPISIIARDAKSSKSIMAIVTLQAGLGNPSPPPQSQSADYYVRKTGSDAGGRDGSDSQPWLTINHALATISSFPGKILQVEAGTYAENVTTAISGTNWTTGLFTVRAKSGDTVIVQPGASGNGALHWDTVSAAYVAWHDFIFDGTNLNSTTSVVKLRGSGVNHIRLLRCIARNAPALGNGILINTPSAFCEIQYGRMHNNSVTRSAYGVYVEGPDNLIEHCEVDTNGGYGVHVNDSNPAHGASRNTVRYCLVHHNNQQSTDAIDGGGIVMTGGSDGFIYNNVIYSNNVAGVQQARGIQVRYDGGGDNHQIYHNTVYDHPVGIETAADSSGNTIRNNIVWNNTTTTIQNGVGDTWSNQITTDPGYVNAGAGNFHLSSSGSSAHNAGFNVLSVVADDYDGVARDTVPDCGAFEFV